MNYICFDIGGTKIKYGLVDDDYNIIEKRLIDTNKDNGGKYVISKVIEIIKENKQRYEIGGVAISTAGIVDHINGSIIYADDVMSNYTGLNICSIIKEKTSLNASVENDVNCFALYHVLKESNDFLMVAIGTGIGGAIVINNNIYHGISNTAGEFGTMIINNTRYENLASVSALVNNARKLGLNIENGLDVFKLYDQADEIAIMAVDNFYKNLAIGLVTLCQIFNFPKIILGGGITNRKTFLSELIKEIEKIKDDAYFNTKIEISSYTNDGGMLGALVHYKKIYNN